MGAGSVEVSDAGLVVQLCAAIALLAVGRMLVAVSSLVPGPSAAGCGWRDRPAGCDGR
jgi:hypothetical protein